MARAVGSSFLAHNPGYSFFIGLIDPPDDSIRQWYQGYKVINCTEIGLDHLDEMAKRYTISELSCALKSYFCAYVLRTEPSATEILYLDSDLFVYSSFADVEALHNSYDILLTPHIISPLVFDGKQPDELAYLATGTYNGGFFSIKVTDNSKRFIEWWCNRMRYYCFYQLGKGLFVDQKWLNLVPVFFEKVHIIMHPGYNVSYWNLHERHIKQNGDAFMVNGNHPLVFFHYSSINLKEGILFYKQQDRFTEDSFPLIKELFMGYRSFVFKEGYEKTSSCTSYYSLINAEFTTALLKKSIKGRIKLWIRKNLSQSTRNKLKDRVQNLIGS